LLNGNPAAWSNFAVSVSVHAVAGCASGAATGGGCGPGALSAAFSKAATAVTASYLDSKNLGDVTIGVAIHAVVGGTAAELGGGKFANGAQTGAFSYLFNYLSQEARARLVAAGAFLGGSAGAVAAGGCTVGTGGVCALGAPTLVAGGAAAGAAAGAAVGAAVDSIEQKINGNSWLSPDPTSVYVLNSNVDGSILKFGITNLVGNETARYSFAELTALNANMTVIATYDSRAPARMLEIGLCMAYVATNGKLPPASSKC